jgi:hypothetical protein
MRIIKTAERLRTSRTDGARARLETAHSAGPASTISMDGGAKPSIDLNVTR